MKTTGALACILAALSPADPGWAADSTADYLRQRGFREGKCYENPAVRRCDRVECWLEVFPGLAGQVGFSLTPSDRLLAGGKETTDYGVFRFRLAKPEKGPGLQAKVLDVRRVPLANWDKTRAGSTEPRSVACPR